MAWFESGGGKVKSVTISVSELYSVDNASTVQGALYLDNIGWKKAYVVSGTGQGSMNINGSTVSVGSYADITNANYINAKAVGAGFNGQRLSFKIRLE